MMKIAFFIAICLYITIDCKADSGENSTEIFSFDWNRLFADPDHVHPRFRRQNSDDLLTPDTASTVLSILPLDRIGTIVGQIMSTGLKEMLNPNVGKKIVNVLENQAPLLLTSLFTNLYSTLGASPVRSSSNPTVSSAILNSNNALKKLSNSSTTSDIINAIRRT